MIANTAPRQDNRPAAEPDVCTYCDSSCPGWVIGINRMVVGIINRHEVTHSDIIAQDDPPRGDYRGALIDEDTLPDFEASPRYCAYLRAANITSES